MNEMSIAKYRTKLLKAIENNRVIVISGRTGCGKSTQVPKYLLAEFPNAKIAIC
jgi:ATP-dependent RNA helicase DHX29